ncbi:MAG: hypothetical protein IJI19_01760, partial [Ruminococcus sp.]|nr:hypothetical protein [Ruminococcus sp.]
MEDKKIEGGLLGKGWGGLNWRSAEQKIRNAAEISDKGFSGQKKEVFDNGDSYEGEWENGTFHGHGKYTFADGSIYDGEWKNDALHGHAKCTYADGEVYEGEYEEG